MRIFLLGAIGTTVVAGLFYWLPENHNVIAGNPPSSKPILKNTVTAGREAFYGDLHLHTTLSFDAFLADTRIGPEDAYKFGKGEPVHLLGNQVKRTIPLDFLAVTDHSENMGVLPQLEDTSSLVYKSDLGKRFRDKDKDAIDQVRKFFFSADPIVPGFDREKVLLSSWQRIIQVADKNNTPGKFTTFIAYEWTSAPGRQNLHRNVFFADSKVPDKPFSSIDSGKPEDLWSYLENQRTKGIEGIAIPHNQNASNGLMYDWVDSDGKEIDRNYAQRRITNEPLNEISQNKGQSETHPLLSSTDEFANFEIADFLAPSLDTQRRVQGSYVRDAYGRGLILQKKTGVNPYKFGVVGASDYHSGLSVSAENEYEGTVSRFNPNPKDVISSPVKTTSRRLTYGSGNLTGVWAEENTRKSIFAAFKRKETFATSGTRLKFRFFAGWDIPKDLLKNKNWVNAAYEKGVPMGGDLLPLKGRSGKPTFIAWAIKDPNSANLDRIQIIKVWTKEGKQQEKVYDVALSGSRKPDPATGKIPAVGNTVDLATATYKNTIGNTELSAVWTDPDFDSSVPAVYYLRVIEIPTPRWSTILAVKTGQPVPGQVPSIIQERGWSSPIWYNP